MRTFLGFPIAAANAGNVPFGQMQPQQRSMYARLFDRLNPGSDGMSDADKQAAIRQGLLGLAAGMASTGGQGTAAAIGNGLQSGLLAMNTSRADHLDRQAREQYMQGQLHDPAGLREHQALVDAATAGMEPEQAAEFRANAAGVRLGMRGRAPSASAKTVTFEGADGRTRTGIFDPMQRSIFGPGGEQFSIDEVQNVRDAWPGMGEQPDPGGAMGGPSALATPQFNPQGGMQGGNPFAGLLAAAPDLRVTSQQRSPERNAQVGGVPNSYHLTGEAIDIGRPTPEQQATIQQWAQANGYRIKNDYADGHWHLEPARGNAPAAVTNAPNAFTSRRPEDDAAAVESAKIQQQLRYADELASADIPQGYRRTADGGLEPVPGGAQAEERRQAEVAEAGKRRREQYLGTVVVQDLDRASEILDDMGDGFWSAQARTRLAGVPGTPWHDLNELIEASRATVSLQNLQELKETTGAGLGNVSEKQSELLASAYGSIRPGQSKQQLQDSINRARNIYLDIVFGHGRGPERKPLSYQSQWQPEDDGWVDESGRQVATFGNLDQRQDAPSGQGNERRLRYNPQTGRLE